MQQLFARKKNSKGLEIFSSAIWCFLCAQNLFVKKNKMKIKKNKQAWNCPDNLKYYTADFNSLICLNHSNVTFGMLHVNSIDFNIGRQYTADYFFVL